MKCKQCGSPAVKLKDSKGATERGEFREEYQCEDCDAQGRIRGRAEAPEREWKKIGSLFNNVQL